MLTMNTLIINYQVEHARKVEHIDVRYKDKLITEGDEDNVSLRYHYQNLNLHIYFTQVIEC